MLLTNGHIATLQNDHSFGLIAGGVIAFDGDQIAWVGSADNLPEAYHGQPAHNLGGRLVTPAYLVGRTKATSWKVRAPI